MSKIKKTELSSPVSAKKRKDKLGRNKMDCLAYKNSNRREKNKLVKLEKHLLKFPDDATAKAAVEVCKKAIRGF
jgi:hypothetical protein